MKSLIASAAILFGAAIPQLATAQSADLTSPQVNPPVVDPYAEPGQDPGHMQPAPMVDEDKSEYQYSYTTTPKPTHVKTPGGMSILGGGGVGGFTDGALTDITKTSGTYNLRLNYGTRTVVGLEAAYVGSTQALDALGVDNDAMLMSNGVEGALRYNFSSGMWQPFVTAGAAWKRYTVQSDVNTSNVSDDDDIIEIPLSAGLAFRNSGFVIEGRGAFRPAVNEDLLGNQALHTWLANLNIGFEF